MTISQSEPKLLASRFLERALLFTILCHASAMLSMAVLLLPGMPGGNSLDARAAYLVVHPWLWRLGWLPWHLTALSDLLLAIALLRTAWIPRFPAYLVLLSTLAAISIEQPNEVIWSFQGPVFAQDAIQNADLASYLAFETQVYVLVAGVAASLYTLSACAWTWCFAKAKVWSPQLTWLSLITWSILLAVSISPLLPANLRPDTGLIAAGNALGFVLMMLWFCAVTELILRRSRLESINGRMARWVHPKRNLLASLLNLVAESRLARAFGEYVPPLSFMSDISNVIYVNYLVEAERLSPLVPWGLELQRLGPDGKYALFTHLSYQHGHFGPSLLGSLRRFMPSPIQSNWRLYVSDPQTNQQGIYFVTTAINQVLPAILARILSEGLPMHLLQKGEIIAKNDGSFELCLDAGGGTAPDLKMRLQTSSEPVLGTPWNLCFDSYQDFLAYCVPQDRGMSSQPWYGRVTRQEIELGIPLELCEALTGTIVSHASQAIVGDAEALCFRVPQVAFRFHREEYDYKAR
jgi:hypothetical protein